MKKTFFYILAFTLLMAGCTSKEQDEQIRAFWQNQLAQVMGVPTLPPSVPVEENEEEIEAVQQELPEEVSQEPQAAVQETTAAPTAPVTPVSAAQKEPITPAPAVKPDQRLRVFLFTHTNSPLCQQLKQEHWDTDFQQKYQDHILLVEYDMIDPANRNPLRNLMHRYQLPSLTVPILFIGDTVLPGYPFTGVEEAVQKALQARARAAARRAAKAKAERARKQNPTQFMEIIMEDERPVKNFKASAKDRQAMQKALTQVEQANQQAVNDIGTMFGSDTQAAAFAITSRTERLLRNQIAFSATYQAYLSTQKKILAVQERNLNDLMRQNAGKLKNIRG